MLFVNGVPLTEVLSFSDLRPGTFWVDEASNSIGMSPPSYTDVWTATIEAAVRSQTLSVQGRTNMVFRGLVFRHGASCMNVDSAQVSGSTNILFDSVQANWNNWGGLGIYGSNEVTVQQLAGQLQRRGRFTRVRGPERSLQLQPDRLQQLARGAGRPV